MSTLKTVNTQKTTAPALRTTHVNVKVTPEELVAFKNNANKYADGNLSSWVRHAAIKLKPVVRAPRVRKKVAATVQAATTAVKTAAKKVAKKATKKAVKKKK